MKKLPLLTIVAALAAGVAAAHAQDWARARLEKSSRHGEWVTLPQGKRQLQSFITYPEVKDKATAVIVIHEIFGMTDWVRGMTDQLAEAGYIAIAPDLLSGMGSKGGGSADFDSSGVGKAIQALPPDQITADLNAVMEYVSKLPACNGKVVVMGFCWGGGQTFRFATNNKNIKAACVFYGPPPQEAAMSNIACPVYGFYGENDARIDATIPKTTEQMKAAGKTYDPITYTGAGHGFMRAGEDPAGNAANKKARDDGWVRIKEILKKI